MHPKRRSAPAHSTEGAAPLTARSIVGLPVLFVLLALVVLYPVTMLVGAVLSVATVGVLI
ncbi:MAG: hypothetical protein ABEJ85_03090 [Haloarculaceae archaeon]